MSWSTVADGLTIERCNEHGDLKITMGIHDSGSEKGNSVFVQFRSDGDREVFRAVERPKEAIDLAKLRDQTKSSQLLLPWNLEKRREGARCQ